MNRIDPQQVAAWFRDHPDVKPMQGLFREQSSSFGMTGCCGLTSQVADRADFPEAYFGPTGTRLPLNPIESVLGIDHDYATGFICGWDNQSLIDREPEYVVFGHADGKAAWEATRAALDAKGVA